MGARRARWWRGVPRGAAWGWGAAPAACDRPFAPNRARIPTIHSARFPYFVARVGGRARCKPIATPAHTAAAAATRHRAVPKARLPRPATPAECTGRRDRRGSQRSHWFGCGPFDYLRHFSRLTHAAPYDNDPTQITEALETELSDINESADGQIISDESAASTEIVNTLTEALTEALEVEIFRD